MTAIKGVEEIAVDVLQLLIANYGADEVQILLNMLDGKDHSIAIKDVTIFASGVLNEIKEALGSDGISGLLKTMHDAAIAQANILEDAKFPKT